MPHITTCDYHATSSLANCSNYFTRLARNEWAWHFLCRWESRGWRSCSIFTLSDAWRPQAAFPKFQFYEARKSRTIPLSCSYEPALFSINPCLLRTLRLQQRLSALSFLLSCCRNWCPFFVFTKRLSLFNSSVLNFSVFALSIPAVISLLISMTPSQLCTPPVHRILKQHLVHFLRMI